MVFFNIFSSKKEEIKNPLIIADHREKNSLVIAELLKKGVDVRFQQLSVGDYLCNDIIVERKTVSDLKSSIINKRIFSQLENMKQYPSPLLLIEGIIEEDVYSSGIHENAFRGFILSLALNHQIPLIFTHDSADTAKYLCLLVQKKPSLEKALRPSRILRTPQEQIQFILEGFPQIGPVKAKKLMEKFGSLKDIINAPEEDLRPLLGKRSSDFRQLVSHATNKIEKGEHE